MKGVVALLAETWSVQSFWRLPNEDLLRFKRGTFTLG
jgi:hypothetical protein